ncbi:hypothetical protein [Rhodanobacter sp. Soil772]|uniref:hypothetical protein n=1 Tax=Rhodanobacter sp. Soil772 TaxID=1736406 RepID=UPI000A4D06A1|nr:hypothetical protein [Rhodanobacter sp. Soil772]
MLKKLLRGVEARAPWLAVGRPLLLRAGFDIKQGYEKTIIGALGEKNDPARELRLRSSLVEHLVAGEKYVRVFKIKSSERAALESWMQSKRAKSNALTDAFPGIAGNQILKNALGTLNSVGYEVFQNGMAAIYTGARAYLERVDVPKSQLKSGASEYEKLFGIRQTLVQTYEAIWLPKSMGVACVCTDFPLTAPKGFSTISQEALKGELQKQLHRIPNPLNLWKAIDGIYNAPGGRAVDYGFTNNEDSVKHHKGRSGTKCLRDDIYDKAGAAAAGDDLSFFKLAMRWKRKRKDLDDEVTDPELLLPGQASFLHAANATLDHAIVRNCYDTDDLNFVLDKILAHV